MIKKLFYGSVGVLVVFSQALTAFAGGPVLVAATEEAVIEEAIVDSGMGGGGMYIDPYYGGGFTFNISTRTFVKPESLSITGDFYLSSSGTEFDTRQEMLDHLNDVYTSIENKLDQYGIVTQTGLNVYAPYVYDGGSSSLEGYLSLRIDLTKMDSLDTVKTVLTEEGFTYWVDAVVSEEAKIDAELSVASKLKLLIDKKKSVYEEILDYTLSKITGLYIYSWPDGYLYNSKTGYVPLMVSADVTYASE